MFIETDSKLNIHFGDFSERGRRMPLSVVNPSFKEINDEVIFLQVNWSWPAPEAEKERGMLTSASKTVLTSPSSSDPEAVKETDWQRQRGSQGSGGVGGFLSPPRLFSSQSCSSLSMPSLNSSCITNLYGSQWCSGTRKIGRSWHWPGAGRRPQEIRLETDNDFGVKDDKNIASKIVLYSPAQCDSEAVEEECGGFLPPPQRFNWSWWWQRRLEYLPAVM